MKKREYNKCTINTDLVNAIHAYRKLSCVWSFQLLEIRCFVFFGDLQKKEKIHVQKSFHQLWLHFTAGKYSLLTKGQHFKQTQVKRKNVLHFTLLGQHIFRYESHYSIDTKDQIPKKTPSFNLINVSSSHIGHGWFLPLCYVYISWLNKPKNSNIIAQRQIKFWSENCFDMCNTSQ